MRMRRSPWLAVAAAVGCSTATGPDSSDEADSSFADQSVRDIDAALDARDASDLVAEREDAGDAPEVQYCPGARGECGWRCCLMDPDRDNLATIDDLYWDWCVDPWTLVGPTDTVLDVLGVERVTPEIVSRLPPVTGWTWRADGTELAVLADMVTCRGFLECQDWCWHDGSTLFVIDTVSDVQLHSEPVDLTSAFPRDWPYVPGRNCPSRSVPECPCTAYAPPGGCCWFELPERGVAFALNNIPFLPDLRRRLADLPVIDDVIEIYPIDVECAWPDLAIGTIDLTIPPPRR